MKTYFKKILQLVLGMEKYLYVFSIFTIKSLKINKREGDFLYFLNIIKDEGILLDIGANIGVMTYYLAKYNPKSIVYSFEPVPINIRTLKKIIDKYRLRNVVLCDYALGNYSGDAEIVMPIVNDVKMQGLSHIVHDSIEELNQGATYKIKIQQLDKLDFLKNSDKKIVAMKLDVENFEYFVIISGKEIIQKNRPIIYCELWENENRQNCFEIMNSLNYNIMILKNKTLINFNAETHRTQNFFFIPRVN